MKTYLSIALIVAIGGCANLDGDPETGNTEFIHADENACALLAGGSDRVTFVDLSPLDWTKMIEIMGTPELETAELIVVDNELWHPVSDRLGIAKRTNTMKIAVSKTPGREMNGSERLAHTGSDTLAGSVAKTPGTEMRGSENLAQPNQTAFEAPTGRSPGRDILGSENLARPAGDTFKMVARPGWNSMARILELCQQQSAIVSVTLAEAPALYGYSTDLTKVSENSRIEKDRRIFKK